MIQDLLSLPYDIRCRIWELVIGPSKLIPCKCVVTPHCCTAIHSRSCVGDFNFFKHCDHQLLRVCKAIHDEVQPLTIRRPMIFTICSGVCLDSFFLGMEIVQRSFIRRVKVKVYIGGLEETSLRNMSGAALLKQAESQCGPFVQNALKCSGVGKVVDAKVISNVEEDAHSRRTVWMRLELTSNTNTFI